MQDQLTFSNCCLLLIKANTTSAHFRSCNGIAESEVLPLSYHETGPELVTLLIFSSNISKKPIVCVTIDDVIGNRLS